MVEKSIDRSTFMHINGLIATAKYDEEFNSARPSIWDITPRDDSSYEAILSALGLEPSPIQYDAKVIPVSSDKEHPSTITIVVSTGSGSGDILPVTVRIVISHKLLVMCHWKLSRKGVLFQITTHLII